MTADEEDDDAINPYGYDLIDPRKGRTDQVRELVFALSTIIHATQAGRIGTLDPDDPGAPTTLETLHHTHSEYQLALLLRGAVAWRTLDDYWTDEVKDYADNGEAHDYTALLDKFRGTDFGVLKDDKARVPLTLREACNKIIHAKSARYLGREFGRRRNHLEMAPGARSRHGPGRARLLRAPKTRSDAVRSSQSSQAP